MSFADYVTTPAQDGSAVRSPLDQEQHLVWSENDIGQFEPTFLIEKRIFVGSLENPVKDDDSNKKTQILLDEFKRHTGNLKLSHRMSMFFYKKNSYNINYPLRSRSNKSPIYQHHINKLDEVTDHATEQPSFHVYRGLKSHELSKKFKVGTVFKDNGFVGTSLSPDIARSFAPPIFSHYSDPTLPNYVQHVAKIEIPPGTKGHYLDTEETPFKREKEFLLKRGTRFQVTGHSIHDNIHTIHMKVHSQTP